jgi:molecular chaperone GrpE
MKNAKEIKLPPDTESETGSVRSGAAPAEAPGDPPPGAPDAAAPEQLAAFEAEKRELLNTLVRRQADFDNYRKRIERERLEDRQRTLGAMIEHLLPVLDAFDMALKAREVFEAESYAKGFELIRKQLGDILAKQGLKRIEAVGQPFDPNFHHAIDRVHSADVPDGTVIAELLAGYLFHDKVLRPAMVRVSVHDQPEGAEPRGMERAN